ncbi:Molybdopterin-guanine dinucleotide biosynthesis protein B (fragment) [uncultured delta proteobacterium]|uniref:Molybdopterin-guanine dinucleotide biosynthesis protein B n=1 Tax=uncultured delta proteobacterium TaxID=34034 RepID=A0A212KE75_9DELT
MQAVVIAGPKKSGKTTLLSLVAEMLERRGKKVAVVKYSNHPLEHDNTDAFWLRRPNRTVVSVAPGETVAFWPEELSFESLVAHLEADVVLLEGGDAPLRVPRVLCLPEDAEDAEAYMEEARSFTLVATVGGVAAIAGEPYFPETDPVAAENIATLVLERGLKV